MRRSAVKDGSSAQQLAPGILAAKRSRTSHSSPGRRRCFLSDNVRLRRSQEGGVAFVPEQALTVELDAEGFMLMEWLDGATDVSSLRVKAGDRFGCNITASEIGRLLGELQQFGIIRWADEVNVFVSARGPSTAPKIEAPECVHLQLTWLCTYRCSSCYLPRQGQSRQEMSKSRLFSLIDELAEIGVFQLALGGGEPLLSPNFVPVVRYAREKGILPNVTTKGSLITDSLLRDIASHIGEIRLSVDDGETFHISFLKNLVTQIKQVGVNFGFNLIVTRPGVSKLRNRLDVFCEFEPTSLVLLRPKPGPLNSEWYSRNSLGRDDCLRLREILADWSGYKHADGLALDCAFSFLFSDLDEKERRQRGVRGCAGGERFCVVEPNGEVYPCSHLHDCAFRIGNVADTPFAEVWTSHLENHKLRSRKLLHRCGACTWEQTCGGCRAIALYESSNVRASDPACPRP